MAVPTQTILWSPISLRPFPCGFRVTHSQVMPWPLQSFWLSPEKMCVVISVAAGSFHRRKGIQGQVDLGIPKALLPT